MWKTSFPSLPILYTSLSRLIDLTFDKAPWARARVHKGPLLHPREEGRSVAASRSSPVDERASKCACAERESNRIIVALRITGERSDQRRRIDRCWSAMREPLPRERTPTLESLSSRTNEPVPSEQGALEYEAFCESSRAWLCSGDRMTLYWVGEKMMRGGGGGMMK